MKNLRFFPVLMSIVFGLCNVVYGATKSSSSSLSSSSSSSSDTSMKIVVTSPTGTAEPIPMIIVDPKAEEKNYVSLDQLLFPKDCIHEEADLLNAVQAIKNPATSLFKYVMIACDFFKNHLFAVDRTQGQEMTLPNKRFLKEIERLGAPECNAYNPMCVIKLYFYFKYQWFVLLYDAVCCDKKSDCFKRLQKEGNEFAEAYDPNSRYGVRFNLQSITYGIPANCQPKLIHIFSPDCATKPVSKNVGQYLDVKRPTVIKVAFEAVENGLQNTDFFDSVETVRKGLKWAKDNACCCGCVIS
jgi:hypothetical protein